MALRREYESDFERLWREYPNKANKLGGYKAWMKHIDEADREELLQHIIERARFDAQWQRGYVPHLQSFINAARWEDDYKRVPSARYAPRYTESKDETPVWQQRGFTSEDDFKRATDAAAERAFAQLRTLH